MEDVGFEFTLLSLRDRSTIQCSPDEEMRETPSGCHAKTGSDRGSELFDVIRYLSTTCSDHP